MPQERNHLCLARDVVSYYRAADGALVCARARAWTLWERASGHVYGWKRTFVRAACARVPRSVCAFGRVLIWTQGSTCVFMRIGKEVEALGSSLQGITFFCHPVSNTPIPFSSLEVSRLLGVILVQGRERRTQKPRGLVCRR